MKEMGQGSAPDWVWEGDSRSGGGAKARALAKSLSFESAASAGSYDKHTIHQFSGRNKAPGSACCEAPAPDLPLGRVSGGASRASRTSDLLGAKSFARKGT